MYVEAVQAGPYTVASVVGDLFGTASGLGSFVVNRLVVVSCGSKRGNVVTGSHGLASLATVGNLSRRHFEPLRGGWWL